MTARADVFALGGILCNLLTGQAVHTGHSASETINKAATGQLAEAMERLDRCGADAELVSIARQCLAADRTQRPIDGQAVAALIGAYRQGVEARLHQAEADRASALVREAEQLKRRRQFYRLSGAVAAILMLGIVGHVDRSGSCESSGRRRSESPRTRPSIRRRRPKAG